MTPSDTRFQTKMADVQDDIARSVDPYSAQGDDPCNCVEYLRISGHGEPGELSFGDGSANARLLMQWLRFREELRSRGLEDRLEFPELDFFEAISGSLCDGATVEFFTCSSGAGPEGDALRQALRQLLGPNVDITLHEEAVGYLFGHQVVCRRKSERKN